MIFIFKMFVKPVLKLLFIYCISKRFGQCQDFGYDGTVGPVYWGEKYHNCIGKLQSPIDIEEDNVKKVKFPPLKFDNFDKHLEEVMIKNNGHTVLVSISKGKKPVIHGGPLNGKYEFSQLHFHWGIDDTEGSENMINNHSFPLELHMVFYKTKYKSFEVAANYSDGLSVLAFLYHATNEDNENYMQFENGLENIQDTTVSKLVNFVSLNKFTTTNRNIYFTYEGSLTTPPCSEVVIWIEFKNTIPLSHTQIQEFRLLPGHGGNLTHNFRPTQPLFDRIIFMNSSGNIMNLCYAIFTLQKFVYLIYLLLVI